MPSFDYMNSPDLRDALVRDYAEMQLCVEQGAWKSAQVLAGSIVECLLIDYLASTTSPSRSPKDPLKMDLGESISICKDEGVLSQRTADLCSVIRSYRNLIHPGRMIRLGEEPPSQTSSQIAVALIDLIVSDIARTRRASVGLTAEQILSKVERDSNAIGILTHLLQEVTEEQRKRLALDLIPNSYLSRDDDDPFDEIAERLVEAHRITLESLTDEPQRGAANAFVSVLKQADGDRVVRYRNAFFRAGDLSHLSAGSYAMAKEHILSAPNPLHSTATLKVLNGIGEHLEPDDTMKWFDPIMRTIVANSVAEYLKKDARTYFVDTLPHTSKSFDERLAARINDWIRHFEKQGLDSNVVKAKSLLEDLKAIGAP